jgi:XTP/dITP diphosphohydrolase
VKLVLATANPDKAKELAALLEGFDVVPRPSELADVEETDDTLEGNARLKAAAVLAATGEAAVADDTGLEVDALDGRPGVRTRRYAGPDATDDENNRKLLAALAGVPPERRGARYVCVLAYIAPGERPVVRRGEFRGRIAQSARGSNGFGYDPIFEPASEPVGGRTVGQLEPEEKARISHRAAAARAMSAALRGE